MRSLCAVVSDCFAEKAGLWGERRESAARARVRARRGRGLRGVCKCRCMMCAGDWGSEVGGRGLM